MKFEGLEEMEEKLKGIRGFLIKHLEEPSQWCLCHYSHYIDSLRLYLLERLRR